MLRNRTTDARRKPSNIRIIVWLRTSPFEVIFHALLNFPQAVIDPHKVLYHAKKTSDRRIPSLQINARFSSGFLSGANYVLRLCPTAQHDPRYLSR